MIIVLFFVVGVGLTVGPWFVPELHSPAQVLLSLMGAAVLIMVAVAAVVTRLYRKASANMAFVRTGMGGARVVRDGGTVVVPVVHQVIPVSLETMRLNVERRGAHALITKDNLRVDLSAEFYIKVQAKTEDILQAARSLGGRNVKPDAVSELVQEKLVSALRTVAATKDLVELHSKRDEFASAVQEIVIHDLAHNGLTLESVTISALDQTDPEQLQDRNVFDAQGLRKIAEITQRAHVERNEILREAERAVAEKDVETRKKVLQLQRDQAEFEAEQQMKVSNVRSARHRETEEFRIEQDEAVARREILKQQAVQTSEVERALAVEKAETDKKIALTAKSREQETAEITKRQALEVADRVKQIAVAQKEQERAAAQASALSAEAERETANQRVTTVKVQAEAQREAEKKLVAAKQVIMENKIREETSADVAAYMAVKQAEADRQAADLQYEAKLRLAEADSQSSIRRAEGEKALRMVDVNVEREKVDVEQARVAVERQGLANKQEFENAALKFELEKLRIDADRDVRIQAATAMGKMLSQAQMQIFGDPETMARMTRQFMDAASYGAATDGLIKSLPPKAQDLLMEFASNLTRQVAGGANGNAVTEHATNGAGAPVPAPTAAAPDTIVAPKADGGPAPQAPASRIAGKKG